MKILFAIITFISYFTHLNSEELNKTNANKTYRVKCTTTKGDFELEIYKDWSPLGAERFIRLVEEGFFEDIAVFRAQENFLGQFGISDKPTFKHNDHWSKSKIRDDKNRYLGIKKHYLSFAGAGPNSRTTQLFIAFVDLDFLGESPWETPIGKIVKGGENWDKIYKGYGASHNSPDQSRIHQDGNKYLRERFPNLDYIIKCNVMKEAEPKLEEEQKKTDM